ncbi:hypothetical protein ES707_22279 [subsurface metagenome]|jgi:hypothetical protein
MQAMYYQPRLNLTSQYKGLTVIAVYAIVSNYGRRCPAEGAEGERDNISILSLETLRQKDYREKPLERSLGEITEGVSPQIE